MDKKNYTYDDLCQMSYQELRRLSILLRLPANIKKKHMISMIEAHQKGDGQAKTEIFNKVIEERNLRRVNIQMKHSKPFILSSRVRAHQVSTDLSVATKHEFETHYSYVAHYTKGNKRSGISGIIKEEAEVSRRNRSVVQQATKSTRKLATVSRTEIMLPRNHSLTTLVQLMPQHERNLIPSSKASLAIANDTTWNASINYDSASSSPSVSDYHCQGNSPFAYGNLSFSPEFSGSLSASSHELYRSLPCWTTREMYSSVIPSIPSNLIVPVMPNMLSSEVTTSQPVGHNSMSKSYSSNYQKQYESFIRCGGSERESFDERDVNYFAGFLSMYNSQEINTFSGNSSKSETNGDTPEPNYDYSRRYNPMKRSNETQHSENLAYLADIYAPKSVSQNSEQVYHIRNIMTDSAKQHHYDNDIAYPLIKARSTEEIAEMAKLENGMSNEGFQCSEYEEHGMMVCTSQRQEYAAENVDAYTHRKRENELDSENHDESSEDVGRYRYLCQESAQQEQTILPSFTPTFHDIPSPESFESEICIYSPLRMSLSRGDNEKIHENPISVTMSNFSQCRYISGHNQYPESISRPYRTPMSVPLFPCATYNTGNDCSYSVCRKGSTDTTAIHLQPIMTSGNRGRFPFYEAERTWNGSMDTTSQSPKDLVGHDNLHHYQRSIFYPYSEEHSPYAFDANNYSNWNEFNENMEAKILPNKSPDVRVVHCKRHGYHYLYSLSSSQ